MVSTPMSARISTASFLQPALVSAATTLRAVSWSSNNPMTEVGMTISSVMFLNQDGRAPISTHPARAHKHTAPQTVPTNHQSFVEKMLLEESILRYFSRFECKILPGAKILPKRDRIYSAKVRFWYMNTI